MSASASGVTRADVDRAAARLAGVAVRTPVVPSTWLADVCRAGGVWLKLETLQRTGSFKLRGAYNALAALREREPGVRAVVTASAGNHGLAVAWAARRLGLAARVFVPETAPAVKRDALAALGAELALAPSYEDAEARAHAAAASEDLTYISPYNDRDVVAGAGTAALEFFEECPDLDTLVVPLGGGGLLSGVALFAKHAGPSIVVIGAEAEASPVFTTSLAAGAITTVSVSPTLADGLAGNLDPGSETFDLVGTLADQVTLVAESSIATAMRELVRRDRLVAEGASAAAVGALLQRGRELADRRIGVILSGRNVDAAVLDRVLCGRS